MIFATLSPTQGRLYLLKGEKTFTNGLGSIPFTKKKKTIKKQKKKPVDRKDAAAGIQPLAG